MCVPSLGKRSMGSVIPTVIRSPGLDLTANWARQKPEKTLIEWDTMYQAASLMLAGNETEMNAEIFKPSMPFI